MTSDGRLLSQVVLVITFAGAACAGLGAALTLTVGHTEGVDTAVFLLAFAVLLPVAVIVIARGGPLAQAEPSVISSIAAVAAIGLTLALLATKLSDVVAGQSPRSSIVLLSMIVVWFAAIAILTARASRGLAVVPSGDRGALSESLPVLLVSVLILLFASTWLSLDGRVLLALLLGGLLLLADRLLRSAELIGRRGIIVLDVAVVVAILLLVSDTVILTLDAEYNRLQEHHDTFLGPVNDVLGGRTLLVDTYAIYGVGSTYFLAALFQLVPIGYGTFGLLTTAGLGVLYAIAYATLRLARCSQVLAVTVMAAAIASSVYATMATPAAWPSIGALRWGFGYLLVFFAVWAARGRGITSSLRIGSATIIGISSIWSFEMFVYTGATYLALVAYWAASRRSREGWLRSVATMLVPAGLACLVAHLALALWTLLRAGQLPNWGPYLAIQREYSIGALDRIVAGPWWLGIPVGASLFASAVGVAAIVWRLPRFESANRAALVAIAGMTAFGIVTFTHLVRFSFNDLVARSDLAVIMVIALWIHLASRSGLARVPRTAFAATGFSLAALLIVVGWPNFTREAGRTPLVAALPGNDSPQSVVSPLWASTESSSSFARAWSNPPIQPRAVTAETLLDRYWPDQQQALVLLFPDLTVEVLMRTGRMNLLPVSSPLADDAIAEDTWERVRPAIDDIEPGTFMLTEGFYLTPGATRDYVVGGAPPLELEQLIIDRLRRRFHFHRVATVEVDDSAVMGDDELIVVRLVPRN